ncbi:MAG: hypothetical protein ACR2F8_13815, partial [Caulobacteraceae bacterium]
FEHGTEQGWELGRAGQAGLEHLGGVGLDHELAGPEGGGEARLRGGERQIGVRAGGRRPDERAPV